MTARASSDNVMRAASISAATVGSVVSNPPTTGLLRSRRYRPRLEVCARRELRERFEREQRGFLYQVFRVHPVVRETVGQPVGTIE